MSAQTDMIEAARLRALVGDCSEVSSGAGAALRSSASLRVALLVRAKLQTHM
jgi:hypothetical protein